MRTLLVIAMVSVLSVGSVPPASAASSLTVLVQTASGAIVSDALVTVDGVGVPSSSDGTPIVADPGVVLVEAFGYLPATFEWDGTPGRLLVTLYSRPVMSLHITGWHAGDETRWNRFLQIAEDTAINSLMIDLKDESGRVFSRTVRGDELGSTREYFDLAERTTQAHEAGLYVVTRIVTFQDPFIGTRQTSWSAWNTATGGPLTRNGQVFLDPWDVNARQYALDLAVEACSDGVDEVQFDYVRFPDGSKTGVLFDGPSGSDGRQEAITTFLGEASESLHPLGCAVAADIFGFIVSIDGEGGIGQQLEALAEVTDVLSPMVYPSHYSSGWFGFSDPNAHPYEVVNAAVADGLARMADSDAILRPWIQDFWYTSSQVGREIAAADDRGVGWMLWNAAGEFSESAIPNQGGLAIEQVQSSADLMVLPPSGFYDVPSSNLFVGDITWLATSGITKGCNSAGDEFCPGQTVSRGQMAAFLVRALGYTDAAISFSDDDGSIFEESIERLATAGVTFGCNPPISDKFCPDSEVTRGQMAAFLARALKLPPASKDFFIDDTGSVFEDAINQIAQAGITRGTGPDTFSPGSSVTRQQMAAFLHRALGD